MPFFLQRIIRWRISFYENFFCLYLKRLLGIRCCDKRTGNDQRRSHIDFSDFLKVRKSVPVYYLYRLKKCAVVNHNKSKRFWLAVAAYPPANRYFFVRKLLLSAKQFSDICQFHYCHPLPLSFSFIKSSPYKTIKTVPHRPVQRHTEPLRFQ